MDKKLLELCIKAPEGQICPTIISRLKDLRRSRDPKKDLQVILNDCIYFSLVSDFALFSLNVLYETI